MKYLCLAAIAASLFGCDESEICSFQNVDQNSYQSNIKCWVDRNGKFNALIIISGNEGNFYPTPISKFCRSEMFGSEKAFIAQQRIPIYVDRLSYGQITINNYRNHPPAIQGDDEILNVIADYDLKTDGKLQFIILKNYKIDKLDKNLEELINKRSNCN